MLNATENERFTQVGPGSPGGELMRRYWHVAAASQELAENPTKAVKLLGEDLVLFKDRSGTLGLLQESCPIGASTCSTASLKRTGCAAPYHGWRFDETGRCLEMPAEAPDSTFKDRVTAVSYPVQELGGLIWAYLGPQPVPFLPGGTSWYGRTWCATWASASSPATGFSAWRTPWTPFTRSGSTPTRCTT